MKICIVGFSGAGKSTLAVALAKKYQLDLLHLDKVQFLPKWEERKDEDKLKIINEFLDTKSNWVIEGNYYKLEFVRRVDEADLIIIKKVNRLLCLYRCFRRYLKFRNKTRPSMAEGCFEQFDFEFIKWILYKGRNPSVLSYLEAYHDKSKIITFRTKDSIESILDKVDKRFNP